MQSTESSSSGQSEGTEEDEDDSETDTSESDEEDEEEVSTALCEERKTVVTRFARHRSNVMNTPSFSPARKTGHSRAIIERPRSPVGNEKPSTDRTASRSLAWTS